MKCVCVSSGGLVGFLATCSRLHSDFSLVSLCCVWIHGPLLAELLYIQHLHLSTPRSSQRFHSQFQTSQKSLTGKHVAVDSVTMIFVFGVGFSGNVSIQGSFRSRYLSYTITSRLLVTNHAEEEIYYLPVFLSWICCEFIQLLWIYWCNITMAFRYFP